jgi:hypothetical protein
MDAVVFNPLYGIRVALSNGSGFDPPTSWSNEEAFVEGNWAIYPRMPADVNGDGMADAVLFHPTLGVKVALSNGSGFDAATWWSTHDALKGDRWWKFPRMLGDVDGDGCADVVHFHPTDGVYVALSDCASSFGDPTIWLQNAQYSRQYWIKWPRMLADVNGNGMMDAVVFSPLFGIRVALSNGSGFDPPVAWSNEEAFIEGNWAIYPRMLADVNGDGMADAALFHPTMGVKVALSNGSGFDAATWWSTDDMLKGDRWWKFPRMLGDVDGDGCADAVHFHPTQGIHVGLAE